MATTPARQRNVAIAQTGRIVGGKLNGWHYAFLEFQLVDGAMCILARVTPPKWPFPKDVLFNIDAGDVRQFRKIAGQRAKRIEVAPLIAAAHAAAENT